MAESGHTCSEQKIIGGLKADMENLKLRDEKRDERDERIAIALEKVAEQSGVIEGLVEVTRDLKKAVNRLFDLDREREKKRIEDAGTSEAEELAAEKAKTFAIRFWESKYSIYGLAAIAIGFGIDVVFHRSVLTELRDLFSLF